MKYTLQELVLLVSLVGTVGGFIGGRLGWLMHVQATLNKRESQLWENMNKRLEVLESRDRECHAALLKAGLLIETTAPVMTPHSEQKP